MIDRDNDLLTIAEAMRLLKVGRTTLFRWLKAGRLRAYHVGPRAVRIRRGDLEAVLRPIHGGEVTAMNEVRPVSTEPIIRPLTEAEAAQQREAYEAAKAHIERMRARRGGKPMAESWPMIREAREERARRL